jgi:hypothetical protein
VTGSINIGNGPVKQAVARAASGDRVFGVVVSVEKHTVVTGLDLDTTYCPASTAMYVKVIPVATLNEYSIPEDAVGGSVATTAVGNNALFIAANCSTVNGQSAYLLDSSSAATTNTHDLCIRGFASQVDNVPGSTATIVVSFNKVALVDQATGV